MLQDATNTVRKAWSIHRHQQTSLPGVLRKATPPYYGDNTDRLVEEAYTAHTAIYLHRLTHNDQPEVWEAVTILLRDAQRCRNTCPQYILQQEGLSTQVGTRLWNHIQLLLPNHQHATLTNH